MDVAMIKGDAISPEGYLKDFINRKVKNLYSIKDFGSGKAALARLRQAISKAPGTVASIAEFTIEGVPGRPTSDAPTNEEIAAHHALTLYAFHQQGKTERMYQQGIRLGEAVARFEIKTKYQSDKKSSIRKRMDILTLSNSSESIATHLRGIIGQLKSESIPLDYGQLAEDICSLYKKKRESEVPLWWGRSYHKAYRNLRRTQKEQ